MEEEFVLMNMSKYKRWRALLDRVSAERQSRWEQTHPMCSHDVEMNEKTEGLNTQNYYKTTSKKWADKKKTDFLFMFVNVLKFQENKFRIVQRDF